MVFQVQPEQYHCYRGLGNRIEDELFRVRILSFYRRYQIRQHKYSRNFDRSEISVKFANFVVFVGTWPFLISNWNFDWSVFVAFARFQDVLMIDVLILNFKIFVKNVHFLSKYKSSIDLTSKRPNTQNQIIKGMTQCWNSRFFHRKL